MLISVWLIVQKAEVEARRLILKMMIKMMEKSLMDSIVNLDMSVAVSLQALTTGPSLKKKNKESWAELKAQTSRLSIKMR